LRYGIEIITRSVKRGDLGGAVEALRHGLGWRLRRLRNRVRRSLRKRGLMRLTGTSSSAGGTSQMNATDSLRAANEVLRSIGAADVDLRATVRGPELSVGVIVPTYADTRFLGDALRSLEQQTYSNWRCYVVDDASPENVDAVMAEFRHDDRFRLLRHGANAGLAAARNTGIRFATEDVLQFLDADDMLTPWSIENRVDELRRHWHDPLIAGVHGQILQCTEETTLDDVGTWKNKPSLGVRDWLSAEGESPFTVHAPLVRTEIVKRLGGFDENFLNGAEDWDFWQRVLRHGYKFPAAPCVVGVYRQRSASMIREHGGIHLGRADELFEASERWAAVDDSIAVSNARMPIGEGRLALKRLVRASRWAGIRVAQSASLDGVVDDEILAFLRPAATVGTRRDECYRAARGGIVRGLGLSVHVVDELDNDTARIIDSAAWRIADELLAYCAERAEFPEPTLDLRRRTHFDVLLLPESVVDVQAFVPLADELRDAGVSVGVVDLDYVNGESGARPALADAGIATVAFNAVALGGVTAGIMVARSPIAPGTAELFGIGREHGATTCFLLDDDPLIVDGLDERLFAATSLRADEIVGVATGKVAPPVEVEPTSEPLTQFTSLLPHEEHALDADGHQWLMDMRDSCAGRTAIIIGNGPSLNDIDFGLLERADTFGVNSIFLASERLTRPLTYYVVEDTAVFKDNTEAIKAYEADTKLFPTLYRPHFDADEIGANTHFFRMNMGFYGRTSPDGPTGTVCLPRFSTNAAQRVFCGQSVTIINLQLAHWLGYSRLLMIGMDFSYQIPSDAEVNGNLIVSRSDDPNHFHPDYFGAGKTWKDPKLDRVLVSYRLAHRVYRATGREIVNCTVGGNLHEFPRATLEEALSVSSVR
jgi:GT2 family glycosyltransferase